MPGYQPRMTTDPVWFNGTNVNTFAASTGLGIRIESITGWDDRPDVRDVRELKFGQDGENADNLYLGGRTITITGGVYGSTWVDLQSRKRALAAVFQPTSTEVLFKVPDPATAAPTAVYATTGMTGYERVSCRVVESIAFADMVGCVGMMFQVSLRASDPRVYSDTETSTTSGTTGSSTRTATVDQAGTYACQPTLTVTGPTGSTWRVAEPTSGLNLEMSGLTLTSTGSVAFDVGARTVSLTDTYEKVRSARSDLVALWMLDEAAGVTADNFQGTAARDGTYTGTYTLNQSGPFTGIASVDLNGSTGYVQIPWVAQLATTTFTFEAWIRPDTISVQGNIVAQCSQAAVGGWQIKVGSDGYLRLALSSAAGIVNMCFTGPGAVSTSAWTHIVAVSTGPTTDPRLYVNGVRTGTTSVTGTHTASTSTGIRIGHYGTIASVDAFDGKIAGVAYYNSVIPESVILDWYRYAGDTSVVGSAYSYLVGSQSRWYPLGTPSSTYSLYSDGLNTGSSLNVKYRDARI